MPLLCLKSSHGFPLHLKYKFLALAYKALCLANPPPHPLCSSHSGFVVCSQTFQTLPTSGSLHLPFPLSGMLFFHIPVTGSFLPFRIHLQSPFFRGGFYLVNRTTPACTSVTLDHNTHSIYC